MFTSAVLGYSEYNIKEFCQSLININDEVFRPLTYLAAPRSYFLQYREICHGLL